jgi:bla regulator protein BlaR1
MWLNATQQIASLLPLLWRASWQAALLTIVVLLLQWTLKDRLPARWRYNLWLIVLLRLLIPVLPESPLSIYNLLTPAPAATISPDPDPITSAEIPVADVLDIDEAAALFAPELLSAPELTNPIDAGSLPSTAKPDPATAVLVSEPFPWRAALAALWLLGLLLFLARIFLATIKLHRLARRLDRITDPAVTKLLDSCKRTMHVRHPVTILASDAIPAPALMGFFKPRLLLPANLLTDFDPRELRLVLLHELAHVRRRDVAVNWLATLLHALHWFNPILWLATSRLRTDRELATDEMVLLAAGHSDDRHLYGQTILKLLQTLSRRGAVLPGVVGILERTHPMRRRITMIAQFTDDHAVRRSRSRWSALALAAALAVGAVTLTGPVRGQAAGDARDEHDAQTTPQPGGVTAVNQAPNADDSAPLTERLRERRERELGRGGGRGGTRGAPGGYGAAGSRGGIGSEAGMGSPYDGPGADPQGAEEEEDAEMRAILERKLPEVKFDNVGFADAIDFLRDVSGANIFVNWRALEAVAIDRQTPVSMRMRNVPVLTVLRLLLDSTAPGLLNYNTEGGVIIITAAPDAQAQLAPPMMGAGGFGGGMPGGFAPGMAAPGAIPSAVTRVYDVRDLLASAATAAPDDAAVNALRNQIAQLRAEIERTSERLGPDHPERQRLDATERALIQRLAASGAGADPSARTTRLNELVTIVQATIGSEQPLNVLGFNTKLIVRAAPEAQAEVQNLLKMLRDDKEDAPARTEPAPRAR